MRILYGKFLPTFKYYTCTYKGEVWMINLDWAVHNVISRAYADAKPKKKRVRK